MGMHPHGRIYGGIFRRQLGRRRDIRRAGGAFDHRQNRFMRREATTSPLSSSNRSSNKWAWESMSISAHLFSVRKRTVQRQKGDVLPSPRRQDHALGKRSPGFAGFKLATMTMVLPTISSAV